MSFINELNKTLGEDFNESITENGATGYKTTQHALLDINFKVASYRSVTNEAVLINDFMKAFYENKALAMRWLFFVRDAREGLGERRYFRVIMRYLAVHETEMTKNLVHLIAEYGRYDDLVALIGTPIEDEVVSVIENTLTSDITNMRDNKPISLIAKWLPSENASSEETKKLARVLIRKMAISPAKYRKMLSKLRAYLKVVERDMSAKRWENIDYSAVPSRANLIYNDAFLRNDETRRIEFLASLEKGETKINASVLYPHDIVHKYCQKSYCILDMTLEALWKALPDTVKGSSNTLVVGDGSGSMNSSVGNTDVTAHEVADALAIYFAERCSGEFKNTYITFGAEPHLVHLNGDTLKDNISIARRNNDCSNTNIEKVFDLILQTAVNGRMKQEEMPANVLIISDMEFDDATSNYGWRSDNVAKPSKKLFKTISDKFASYGYVMPKLIFWNVNSRTNTIPVKDNDMGVALVSGFSVNIMKMVMSDKLDPYEILLETICAERYNPIQDALCATNRS